MLLSLATVVVAVAAHPATRIVVSWDGALGARIRKTRGARSRGLPGRGGGGMLPPIADQLMLSVRTVESHLCRAIQKLGVSQRRELAALRAGTVRDRWFLNVLRPPRAELQ